MAGWRTPPFITVPDLGCDRCVYLLFKADRWNYQHWRLDIKNFSKEPRSLGFYSSSSYVRAQSHFSPFIKTFYFCLRDWRENVWPNAAPQQCCRFPPLNNLDLSCLVTKQIFISNCCGYCSLQLVTTVTRWLVQLVLSNSCNSSSHPLSEEPQHVQGREERSGGGIREGKPAGE